MTTTSFSIAASAMKAREMEVSTIANNLANMNTTGYFAERLALADLPYIYERRPGVKTDANEAQPAPTGIEYGLGVKIVGTYRLFNEVEVKQTKSPYDVAITGKGFFKIIMSDGTFSYTRAGQFGPNAVGQLVDPAGNVVSPGITIPQNVPQDGISINSSGQIYVSIPGQTQLQLLGQLDIVDFQNPDGLLPVGDNLFTETESSGTPVTGQPGIDGMGLMRGGWLEGSNVDAVKELTDLIRAQRNYELCSKIISSSDDMLKQIATIKQ